MAPKEFVLTFMLDSAVRRLICLSSLRIVSCHGGE